MNDEYFGSDINIMTSSAMIRVLITKTGLNDHNRGALLIEWQLRHGGIKEFYIETVRTIDQMIDTALQEDINIVVINVMSGDHFSVAEKILNKMKEEVISDKALMIVGAIPDEDVPRLLKMGVFAAFSSGDSYDEIMNVILYAVESFHDVNLLHDFKNNISQEISI